MSKLFKHFIALVNKQYEIDIKQVQFDSGGEFRVLDHLLFEGGYNKRVSCSYTSSHNRVIECKFRHLFKTILSLLLKVFLTLEFWEYALSCAIHIINRMPSKTYGLKALYELLYNETPSYAHLRTFGCLCYPFTKPYNSNKLEPRSIPCIFFGYPS